MPFVKYCNFCIAIALRACMRRLRICIDHWLYYNAYPHRTGEQSRGGVRGPFCWWMLMGELQEKRLMRTRWLSLSSLWQTHTNTPFVGFSSKAGSPLAAQDRLSDDDEEEMLSAACVGLCRNGEVGVSKVQTPCSWFLSGNYSNPSRRDSKWITLVIYILKSPWGSGSGIMLDN